MPERAYALNGKIIHTLNPLRNLRFFRRFKRLDDALASKIYNYISDTKKYDNYSMMVYLSEVKVLKRH